MKPIWHLQTYGGNLAQPIPQNKLAGMVRNDTLTPAQPGDVYSVQPNGDLMARDPTKIGAWETCVLDGVALKYTVEGNVFVFIPESL